jgi:hypothetical protein
MKYAMRLKEPPDGFLYWTRADMAVARIRIEDFQWALREPGWDSLKGTS